MKKGRFFTPTKVRLILSITLILSFVFIAGNFYFAYREIEKMANEVGQKVAEANSSRQTLQRLQMLNRELEVNKEAVSKAKRISADTKNYFYQDQLINDLTTYANRSGMVINDITFSPPVSEGATPATGTAEQTAATPATLKTTAVTVTLKNPVDYRGYLNFLNYIEQNLTKMKIANVSLTKGDKGSVTTSALSLEVFLR